ncbi:MAG: hypothetical protein A3B03_00145 [Candidatus Zambryskibacteria bacterium RIFCSPLOWO2_01_FULL_42_41]|nr:MAG: hypothetical protein A3B03_00145 [Candidatus Zambryskibacteria bacterium RIFCSPLOWO2_01_FULL_42_41]
MLIAEDNWSARENLVHSLKLEGHVVVSVGDGQTAWDLLDQGEKFDLIMSDNDMPNMTGVELLRRVRMDKRTAHIPFALMSGWMTVSGHDSTDLEKMCAEFQATFVEKPFDFEVVIIKLLGFKREVDDS